MLMTNDPSYLNNYPCFIAFTSIKKQANLTLKLFFFNSFPFYPKKINTTSEQTPTQQNRRKDDENFKK
jgi:hypothetical protein